MLRQTEGSSADVGNEPVDQDTFGVMRDDLMRQQAAHNEWQREQAGGDEWEPARFYLEHSSGENLPHRTSLGAHLIGILASFIRIGEVVFAVIIMLSVFLGILTLIIP